MTNASSYLLAGALHSLSHTDSNQERMAMIAHIEDLVAP
jgi:hypothetical protein